MLTTRSSGYIVKSQRERFWRKVIIAVVIAPMVLVIALSIAELWSK